MVGSCCECEFLTLIAAEITNKSCYEVRNEYWPICAALCYSITGEGTNLYQNRQLCHNGDDVIQWKNASRNLYAHCKDTFNVGYMCVKILPLIFGLFLMSLHCAKLSNSNSFVLWSELKCFKEYPYVSSPQLSIEFYWTSNWSACYISLCVADQLTY